MGQTKNDVMGEMPIKTKWGKLCKNTEHSFDKKHAPVNTLDIPLDIVLSQPTCKHSEQLFRKKTRVTALLVMLEMNVF